MKILTKPIPLLLLVLLTLLLLASIVWAQKSNLYDLSWWTVDNGGGAASGGELELVGTVGQTEVGPVIEGGDMILSSGFWPSGGEAVSCQHPLEGVSLSGPSLGGTGDPLTYTITLLPSNSTQPIEYTWSPNGLVSALDEQASYNWPGGGSKSVMVNVRNCGNEDFGAGQVVTITAPCPSPLVGVTISGRRMGYPGQEYSFTALPDPTDATHPLTYTWSSFGLVDDPGVITDTAVYTWTTLGPHTINLDAQNCGGTIGVSHTIAIVEPPPPCDYALSGVNLNGPSSGHTGEALCFAATMDPSTATMPIIYIWSSDGLVSAQQDTGEAFYRWDNPGSKNVGLTVENCDGTPYLASQAVTITRLCPVPIIGASISGLISGYVDIEYSLTALPNPTDATEPLTYTWSGDGLLSGQGLSETVYSWDTMGVHTASVSIENCGGLADAEHAILLCLNPISGVTISGTSLAELYTDYVFTATVEPPGADPPISYVWSDDNLVSGQGNITATYRWGQSGSGTLSFYEIAVSASNCGRTRNDVHLIAVSTQRKVYLPLISRW
jgi:hypothetical protein